MLLENMLLQFARNYMCKKCEYLVGKSVTCRPHIPQNRDVNKNQNYKNEEKPQAIRNLYSVFFTHLSTTLKQSLPQLKYGFTQFPQHLSPSLLLIK